MSRKDLATLKREAEIDESNPFEVACWAQVERIYTINERNGAIPPLRKALEWFEVEELYKKLQAAPSQEKLDALTKAIDEYEAL